MRRLIVAGGLISMMLMAGAGQAQGPRNLEAGMRIRVVPLHGPRETGVVSSVAADSIGFIRDMTGAVPGMLARRNIQRVQISRGRNRVLGFFAKAAIGTALGVASGAIVGGATYDEGDCDIFVCSRSGAAAFAGMMFGALGFVTGGIVGAATGWEQWSEASPGGQ